jgi:hypothetical protein
MMISACTANGTFLYEVRDVWDDAGCCITVYVPFGSLHQRRVGQRKNNCFLWFRFGNIGIGNAVSSCDGNDNDDINNNSLTAVQNPYTAFSRAFSIADIKPYDADRSRVADIH